MKTFNYKFVKDLNVDFIYLLNSDITEAFGEFFLEKRVHAYSETDFYFIGTDMDQIKMIQIIKNMIHFGLENELISDKNIYSYHDVTKVDNLIQDDVTNLYSKNNVLVDTYYEFNNSDDVLDKILEKGIESLNKYDLNILKSIN